MLENLILEPCWKWYDVTFVAFCTRRFWMKWSCKLVGATSNAQIFVAVAFDAFQFFAFWWKFDISEELSKSTTNAFAGFIYWHELFVKEIDWENEKMVVYEKTKTTGRGMHENEMNIQDLFEKQLCRKFIYDDKCLTFAESVKLAESMVGDGQYNLVYDNCEHTARFLKTGRKESLQVKNACWYAFNLLCTNVPKFLRAAAVRSLVFTVAEILVRELVQQLAPHITASLLIGVEGIAAIVAYLIIYMFDVIKLKKQLENHEINQDNFKDLRTILRYKLSGAALGSLIGILVASPAGVFGIGGILLACIASFIGSLIFSVIMENFAFWVVRRRNEKSSKTRNEDSLKNRLMAAHKEWNHAWMKTPEV